MSQTRRTSVATDSLDELVDRLIECGGVLSQMVAHMVEFQESGRSAPDAPPIPDVLRTLVRESVRQIRRRHSKADIRTAAAIVDQVTDAICSEILFVPADPAPPGE